MGTGTGKFGNHYWHASLRFRYVRARSIGRERLRALKALRVIVDTEKEELLVKKLVKKREFASIPKIWHILLNRGGVIEP